MPSLHQNIVPMKDYRDPREQTVTVESVLAAKRAHDAERIANGLPPDYSHDAKDAWEFDAAKTGLRNLIRKYGASRVMALCVYLAAETGQEV